MKIISQRNMFKTTCIVKTVFLKNILFILNSKGGISKIKTFFLTTTKKINFLPTAKKELVLMEEIFIY